MWGGNRHDGGALTLVPDRNVQAGIAGSLAVHLLVLLLMAGGMGAQLVQSWMIEEVLQEAPKEEIVEVFAEQFITEPEPEPEVKPEPEPEPEKKVAEEPPAPMPPEAAPKRYIRTTQNAGVDKAPKNAAFQSDRNTVASSRLAASPDGTMPLPTTQGMKTPTLELANRDFDKNGVEDGPPPGGAPVAATASINGAQGNAAAMPEKKAAESLREMMTEKADEDGPGDRLPLEVKKAETAVGPTGSNVPTPGMLAEGQGNANTPPGKLPAMRETADAQGEAMTTMTRTSEVHGTITNRGEEDSVDAEMTASGSYMKEVMGSLEKTWHLYRLLVPEAIAAGELEVQFYINKNGQAEEVQILTPPDKSDPRMIQFTMRAIQDFKKPAIPEALLADLPDGRFLVRCNVLLY